MITTVLLPFAEQLNHSFKEHQFSFCKAENSIHFDSHEIDCSVFHFKINLAKIDFTSEIQFTEIIKNEEKIVSLETKTSTVKLHYKSSRAPPFLLT